MTGAAGVVGMRCAGSMSVSLYWLIGARSSSGSVGSSGSMPGSMLGLPSGALGLPAAAAPPPIKLLTAVSTFQSCASRNEMANPSSSVPETALNMANFSLWSVITAHAVKAVALSAGAGRKFELVGPISPRPKVSKVSK